MTLYDLQNNYRTFLDIAEEGEISPEALEEKIQTAIREGLEIAKDF